MCNDDYLTVLTVERNNFTSQNFTQRLQVTILNGVDSIM